MILLNKKYLNSQNGIAITEIIIIAPILILLIYIALEINHKFEQKIEMAIQTRNSLAIAKSDNATVHINNNKTVKLFEGGSVR